MRGVPRECAHVHGGHAVPQRPCSVSFFVSVCLSVCLSVSVCLSLSLSLPLFFKFHLISRSATEFCLLICVPLSFSCHFLFPQQLDTGNGHGCRTAVA